MRHLIWISAVALVLAACSKEEPAAPAVEEPAVVEETVVEEVIDEITDEAATDEVLEVVEESAAEPEPEEQPIILAQADVPVPPVEWKYKEGEHYARLVPTQSTLGGADKIEVAEFFYYACPHCFTFEPVIKGWAENKPANVRFVQIPAMWNGYLVLQARLYYTKEVLARNGILEDGDAFHNAVYEEMHRRRNRLASEDAVQRLFERFGVSADEFKRTWDSFEVAQKLRVAQDLGRRYSIPSTPAIVVNGKYRTGGKEAGGIPQLLELIDELILRESLR
jgi:thiol:disulfide interchange protein DsbA